ncbi:DUF4974 domain-containing protein [Neolewinella aurantiaca]|uniref:DUF4974 domain-containing protein n=1 Tax=Neolewinella aurantiaca TaxID=2602767 RepID=A0A5C7FQN1_9BACT|nr:FecR domain-containing protein [Neolewinella aurantiaca]TXF90135.1 DUF4974 domain-containing protein [Neolewinella aurantiaca]
MATPDFKDDTFLARWLSGELSPAEQEEFRLRADFAGYERIVEHLGRMKPPAFDAEAEFGKLKSKQASLAKGGAKERALHPRPRLLKRIWPWSVAAAVALILSFWFLMRPEAASFVTANGAQRTAALKDGSTAQVNAGSEFGFIVTDTQRTASLNGEAYFEVEKSTIPFVVNTKQGSVRVLGTSFNVYSREDRLAVSCTSGKVSVRFVGDPQDYPIGPGQSVSRSLGDTVVLAAATGTEQLDWLSGKSVFVNRPLKEILDELERQYDITVDRPAGLDVQETYTVTFKNDDLELALEQALNPIPGFEYERVGAVVSFRPLE